MKIVTIELSIFVIPIINKNLSIKDTIIKLIMIRAIKSNAYLKS